MDRPACHAQLRRVAVSVYLASLADAAPLPRCPGVSTRAMRSALRIIGDDRDTTEIGHGLILATA